MSPGSSTDVFYLMRKHSTQLFLAEVEVMEEGWGWGGSLSLKLRKRAWREGGCRFGLALYR